MITMAFHYREHKRTWLFNLEQGVAENLERKGSKKFKHLFFWQAKEKSERKGEGGSTEEKHKNLNLIQKQENWDFHFLPSVSD